jgi:predicted RNA binding protein YcfA (HicA-like mRNA interferase family)
MPRKIRQLIKDLEKAGFVFEPGKGSHRKFYHPKVALPVTVSGKLGDDAQRYQEEQVKRAIRASKL